MTGRSATAGVTLVEMLVALALMAVIGVAGIAVLQQVLRAQDRTAARLDRLGEMQRTMVVVTLDFATALPFSLAAGANGTAIARQADAPVRVDYALEGGTLWRRVGGAAGEPVASQALVRGVDRAAWRYLAASDGWSDVWPPEGTQARLGDAANPRAVELRLWLKDGGTLRRVAALPGGPP